MKRKGLLLIGLFYACSASAFTLEEATIDSIHQAIRNHEITCETLITNYLERVKKYNLSVKQKAPLNAFTELNPSVLNNARQIDNEFAKTQKLSGSLHCIPVVLKDNIDSFDTTTTAGSYALLGNQPVHDAFLVTELRKEGAVILGKGGMDEFAWGVIGINSRNGRIGNAYDTNRNPGGSSGGVGTAISANFAVLGVGTDNSGSVRIPAVFNGLVGLRPSQGLISQEGIFPMGNLDGTAGPMTRTIKDLAILLNVIAKKDDKNSSVPHVKNYLAFLDENGLQKKRIGVLRQVGSIDTFKDIPPDAVSVLQKALDKMHELGATLINVDLSQFNNDRSLNQTGEIDDINIYLQAFPAVRQNFHDICESDRTRTFGTRDKCIEFMTSTESKSSVSYQEALKLFKKNRNYVYKVMSDNHLDALLIPISTHGSATYDEKSINTWRAPVSSNAGLPALAFVAGYSDFNKMPIGIELIGKQFDEGKLIEMAYSYEKHAEPRKVPIMPAINTQLIQYSIPQFNNLISQIGKTTYDQVLKNADPTVNISDVLTAEVFQGIVAKEIGG